MIQILLLASLYEVKTACSFQSFEEAQLKSDNFYGELEYIRENPYAFGVWTMYAPLRNNYQPSSKLYYDQSGSQNGYHILNFQSSNTIQTLYLLKPVTFDFSSPYAKQTIFQRTTTGVIQYTFQYHPEYYEGYWVFTYFCFYYSTKYNFVSYTTGEKLFMNKLVTTETLFAQTTNAKLEFGGQGEYLISTTNLNLNIYPGRISIVTIMDSPQFFSNADETAFLNYIQNCYIPTACQQNQQLTILDQTYSQFNITIKQFMVDIPGSEFTIEFWIRRDPIFETSILEYIFSYGGQFQSQTNFQQMFLFCKPYLHDMLFNHQFQFYYQIPTVDYQGEIYIDGGQSFISFFDLSKWNYFRYEFFREDINSIIMLSIYGSSNDRFEQSQLLSYSETFQYTNYQATVSIFDIIDYGTVGYSPFQGDLANFKIKYCYSGHPDFDANSNLNCHDSCKTCNGPTQWNCLTCYDEQNRQLQPDLHMCLCSFDYLEEQFICKEKISQITQVSQAITLDKFQCNFGYFEAWRDGRFLGCIACPNLNSPQIRCLNCLLNSRTWYSNPICNINFISTDDTYFSIESVDDFDFYLIDYNEMSINLCIGCASFNNHKQQCKDNRYYFQNNCILCATNCLKCNNSNCIQCQVGYYLQENICQQCNLNCINCEVNLNKVTCTLCPQGYVLFKGDCLQCGKNCKECEIRSINENYYKKCLRCSYETYISLDGESCFDNTVEYCRYPFQFSSLNKNIATILHDFAPQPVEDIQIGCMFCESHSKLSLSTNSLLSCEPYTMYKYGRGCVQGVIKEGQSICFIGNFQKNIVMNEIGGYSYCTQFIPFCLHCFGYDTEFLLYCYRCAEGYYVDYYKGVCTHCPNQCLRCYETDSSKLEKQLTHILQVTFFDFDYFDFDQVTKDPNKNNVQILCTKCNEGYTLYNYLCIQNCPFNCKECIVNNNQQICISCLQLTKYSYFSLQDGQCIACPFNCKLCILRTEEEIKAINPYFDNESFKFYSNPCVQPFDNNLFYDQDIKQFITCNECQKIVTLEINIYCSTHTSDIFNIQLDQLFNTNPQNYLSSIETKDYYGYLNTEYVKYLNYKFIFQQNSVCYIDSSTYFSSFLQKNVFNLLAINLEINGNNSTIIFNGNTTISNFTSITIKNFHIQNGGFIITNIKEQSIILENIFITFDKLNLITKSAFQLFHVSNVLMNGIVIRDVNSNTGGTVILLSNQESSIQFVMNHFTIEKSYFVTFNCLQFITNQILITIHDILISKSTLSEFKLFDLGNYTKTTFELDVLSIQDSTIMNSNSFLQFSNSANINQILVSNTKINNTLLIVMYQELVLINSSFQNLYIYGNSTLLSTSSNLETQIILLTNVKFINIIYEAKQAIMLIRKSNPHLLIVNFSQIQLVKVSINIDLLVSYQQSKEQSLFYIEADVVSFKNMTIQRGIGYSEFTLIQVNQFYFINSSISLDQKYQFRSLSQLDCSFSTNYFMYGGMMFLLDIGETEFTSVNIENTILYNSVLIDFLVSDNQQNTTFSMVNCIMSNNIIHQTTTQSTISLLYISSPLASLQVILKNNQYNSNLLDIEIENTLSQQGLLFTINSDQAIIGDCKFISNFIINGSSSIFVINSDTILIEGTEFYNNSIFQYDTIKQFLVWSFEGEIFQEDLEKLYPVTSIGGNGNLQARIVNIKNSAVANSYSKYGAAFKISIVQNGTFLVFNSQFSNLRTDMSDNSQGGCFHISTYSQRVEIDFADSIFTQITSRQSGGLLYLQTSTKQAQITFNNLSLINIFSLQGSLVNIEQSQQGSSQFKMINCICENGETQFQQFINNIQNVTSSEFARLLEFHSLVYFIGGSIQISNLTVSQYPYLQLFYFQNSILLINIKILNTIFTRPLLLFNKNQDPISIQISGLDLSNCSLLETLQLQTIHTVSIQQILLPSCQTHQLPESISLAGYQISNKNFDTLSRLLFESKVQSVIQFNNFQQEDSIKLKLININIKCNFCQNGALGLLNLNSPVVSIENIKISESKCGINGCLFISSSQQRLLSSVEISNRTSIVIRNLLCYHNYAKYGGCLHLKQQEVKILYSSMIQNEAEQGGAIYIQGVGSGILAVELSLINNNAIEGSGLYANELFVYSQNGITYYDSLGAVTKQQPSRLKVQIFPNFTLTPSIIYQDSYHQVNKILSSDGKEVILYMPTGMKLQNYRRFDIKQNTYSDQQQLFRLIAFTDQTQIIDLEGTYCTCEVLMNNDTKVGNLTSQTTFYFNQSSYNFDDLILYLPQNRSQKFWLKFWCNSIYIPISESNEVMRFHQNYTLLIRVKPYQCQLGEYHVGDEDYCHPCSIDTQQYSVRVNSTQCQVKNQLQISEITAAQLKLYQGYWRYQVTSPTIDFCSNKEENCIGGWSVGDNLCVEGSIGGLCEQCDYYNIRGSGFYQRLRQFECQLCQLSKIQSNLTKLILTIFMQQIAIQFSFTILFIYLNRLQQNRQRSILQFFTLRAYEMKFREVTSGQSIKVILYFFQLISLVAELKQIYSEGIQIIIDLIGNPFQQLALFNICHLIDANINVIYMDLLQNSIFVAMIALIFIIICLLFSKKWKLSQATLINFTYLYFIFFQSSFIRQNLKLISVRSIQGEKWIYQNVAYLYQTQSHLIIVFSCISPILVIFGVIVPMVLFLKLRQYKTNMRRRTFRDFGFWFTEYYEYHLEAVKIITLTVISVCIISIDGDVSLRFIFAFVTIITYRKLFPSTTIYFNFQLNQLESHLIIVSICILVLSTFYSKIDITIIKQIVEYLLYVSLIFSLALIFSSLYRFNFQTIKQVMQNIIRSFIDHYPQFIGYGICYRFSKVSSEKYQRRLELLRKYLLTKGKIALSKKKEIEQTIAI